MKLMPSLSKPSTTSALRAACAFGLLLLPLLASAGEADPLKELRTRANSNNDNIVWIIRWIGIVIVLIGGLLALAQVKKRDWVAIAGWVGLALFGMFLGVYAENAFKALKGE